VEGKRGKEVDTVVLFFYHKKAGKEGKRKVT
jgi:hypothetical protein